MIAVLAGGVGAARFLRGLVEVVPANEVVAIVNVGDDIDHLGLHISPDIDSIVYRLAGVFNVEQQWGRGDESFVVAEELARFGHEPWFTLGDRDLAVHIHRTMRLRQGVPLSQVTTEIAGSFNLDIRLLPATDDPVETRITTVDDRDIGFQEYWVKERAQADVAGIRLDGAETAQPAPGVVATLLEADTVLLAPSNPVVSIGTILAVPGIRQALLGTKAPIVGVSPIIGGKVVRGMADRLLPAVGADVSCTGVAAHYHGLLDGWIIDKRDAHAVEDVEALGIACRAADTIMDELATTVSLARACLELADQLRS